MGSTISIEKTKLVEMLNLEQLNLFQKNYTEIELAYLAGFFDGEGYIGIVANSGYKKRRTNYSLRLTIISTDKKIIDLLDKKFGSSCLICIPNWKKNKNHRTAYRIQWGDLKALKILRLISKYLIVKKKRAELALEFGKTIIPKRGNKGKGLSTWERDVRKQIYNEMKILNKRGLIDSTVKAKSARGREPKVETDAFISHEKADPSAQGSHGAEKSFPPKDSPWMLKVQGGSTLPEGERD